MGVILDTTSDYDMPSDVYNFQFSHTVADKANNIVFLIYCNAGSRLITSATYGGEAMTAAIETTPYGDCYVQIFYLVNPPTGANNFYAELSGQSNGRGLCGGISFYNVDTTDPIDQTDESSDTATSISTSFTPTYASTYAIEGQFNNNTAAGSAGSGQTTIASRSGNDSGGCSYKQVSSSADSVSWTGLDSGSAVSQGLVVIKPLPEGGAFLFNML